MWLFAPQNTAMLKIYSIVARKKSKQTNILPDRYITLVGFRLDYVILFQDMHINI